MRPVRLLHVLAPLAVAWTGFSASGQDGRLPYIAPEGDVIERRNDPIRLPGLNREIRRFDFEERTRQPYQFPLRFYRISSHSSDGQSRPGFPLFGRMEFSDAEAHLGAWSFMFQTEGGSMAAATAPNTVPVIPGGDYLISAWVKTDDLEHARARVIGVFYNGRGEPIEKSLTEGKLLITRGAWQHVTVEMTGRFPDAVDLVIELQLLQPAQFQPASDDRHRPLLQDVKGRAWFDDVSVWHLPRIELETGVPGNVIVMPQKPALRLVVSDLATEPIQADVNIFGLDGHVVYTTSLPIRRGRSGDVLDLSSLPLGWYRAQVLLRNESQTLGRTHLDFAYVNDLSPLSHVEGSLGVNIDDYSIDELNLAAEMVSKLRFPTAVVPAWDRTYDTGGINSGFERMRPAIERLLDSNVEVIFAIPIVPQDLARTLVLDRRQVLDMFAADPQLLRPYLQDILIYFGQRVRHWQVGPTGDSRAFWRDDLQSAHDATRKALAHLVPGPKVVLPWSVEQTVDPALNISAYHLQVPHNVPPESIPEYAAEWIKGGGDVLVTLQQLPAQRYDHSQRAIDLVMRTLYAWRSGVTRLLIEDPWTVVHGRDVVMTPDASLPCWLVMTHMLAGRTFGGEVPIGDGLRCWQFDGESDSILVAWNERRSPDQARLITQLGEGEVRVVDVFGNRRAIAPDDGAHEVDLSEVPLFIEGVDPHLMRFRQRFAVTPTMVQSIAREHLVELTLHNPWDVVMTGSLRFQSPSGWSYSPRRLSFSIPPGETQNLPFGLAFGRTEIAGHKELEVEFEFNAVREYRFRAAAPFTVGLDEFEVEPLWRLSRNVNGEMHDLVVSAYITNRSDRPLSLEAFMLAPGHRREKRSISNLDPGDTVVKSFYIFDGARSLSGSRILIGAGLIDDPARLNRAIQLPDLTASALAIESSAAQ